MSTTTASGSCWPQIVAIDEPHLRSLLDQDLGNDLSFGELQVSHPHLFAAAPLLLTPAVTEAMDRVIAAIEHVVGSRSYREKVLSAAPSIARAAPGPAGVFYSYDFHLSADGPRLIEINTNAGGAVLSAYQAAAQRACCEPVAERLAGAKELYSIEHDLVEMFRQEMELFDATRTLQRVAIVDERPTEQFLYPELLLLRSMFQRASIDCEIVDPRELQVADFDLVYNRTTDFYLATELTSGLREAYRGRQLAVTPHPHGYALYADKRNLVHLSNESAFEDLEIPAAAAEVLSASVPLTVAVDASNADRLWQERKKWFFKPINGFGSRGAYRGDKVTRRVFEQIRQGDYIAQHRVEPMRHAIDLGAKTVDLKSDIRAIVYRGHRQLLTSRLYQGQVTNLRTAGGGLASVFSIKDT